MAFDERFQRQVALLLKAIPLINKESCFALKGGTAINLFVRDLPRLSVDIDLTYLSVLPRARSLGAIDKAMKRIEVRLAKAIPRAQIRRTVKEGAILRLIVQEGRTQIQIEVTPVLRGCVFDPEVRSVSEKVEEQFGFAEIKVVSFADLYAGKILAALDRQTPRDLFDIRDLLANEGITDEIRDAFVIYLMSHNRPMSELLSSPQKDIRQDFEAAFAGMTDQPITLKELTDARKELKSELIGKMPNKHREFLVDFEAGQPDWTKLSIPGAQRLPAIKWRQQNFDRLPRNNRINNVETLAKVLGVKPKPAQLTLFAEPKPKSQKRRPSKKSKTAPRKRKSKK